MALYNSDFNPINHWNNRLIAAESESTEEHGHAGCSYGKLLVSGQVLGKPGTILYIIYRICFCGRYFSKANTKDKRILNVLYVQDGVEVHVTNDCYYRAQPLPGGEIRLQKVCYCPRQAQYF